MGLRKEEPERPVWIADEAIDLIPLFPEPRVFNTDEAIFKSLFQPRVFHADEAIDLIPLFPEPRVFNADTILLLTLISFLLGRADARAEPKRGGRPRTDPALIDKLTRKLLLLWRMRVRTPKRPMVKDGANLVRKMLARHLRRRGAKPIKLGKRIIDTIASSARDQLAG